MMMSLGLFLFTLPTIVYQDMAHNRDVRFAWNERMGAGDAPQFIGPGTETITLTGITAHGISHAGPSFGLLNTMMQQGRAWPLVDGLGNVFGQYVILALPVKKTIFDRQGQPRRQEWSLELRRADRPGGAIRNALLDAALDRLGHPERMIADKLSIASLGIKLPGMGQ